MITIGVDAHRAAPRRGRGRWDRPGAGAVARGQPTGGLGRRSGPGRWPSAARASGGSKAPGITAAGLAQALVAAGETVYEVNPRLDGRGRGAAPASATRATALDARAVARAVQQEERPPAGPAPRTRRRCSICWSTERDAALAEATRLRNQAHHLLGQLDPAYREHLPTLASQAGVRALEAYAAPAAGTSSSSGPPRSAGWAQRLRVLQAQIADLKAQIVARAQPRFAPLTAIHGVNLLTAGALAGLLGPGQRFTTDAQLAAYAGVAPLEASSAGQVRHRLNRGGNRRLNAILYRIAMTQARHLPEARAYLDRRMARREDEPGGDAGAEAVHRARRLAAVEGVPGRQPAVGRGAPGGVGRSDAVS